MESPLKILSTTESHGVHHIALTPNNRYIISGSNDNQDGSREGKVKVWDGAKDYQLQLQLSLTSNNYIEAITTINKYVAIGTGFIVFLWDLTTNTFAKEFTGQQPKDPWEVTSIIDVTTTRDGKKIIASDWNA